MPFERFVVLSVTGIEPFVTLAAAIYGHLGPTLGRFGVILGLIWDRFGVILGLIWDHFDLVLSSLSIVLVSF